MGARGALLLLAFCGRPESSAVQPLDPLHAGSRPEAILKGPARVSLAEEAVFDGSGSLGMGLSYSWSLGDGASPEGPLVLHRYEAVGRYVVQLVVRDPDGLTDSAALVVEVVEDVIPPGPPPSTPPPPESEDTPPPIDEPAPPEAQLVVTPSPVREGVPVLFDGSGSTSAVGLVAYVWSFGDSSPAAEGAQQTHTYAFAGSYLVTLDVEDIAGQRDTQSLWLEVQPSSTAEPTYTIQDLQGAYALTANPQTRVCQSYTAVFDESSLRITEAALPVAGCDQAVVAVGDGYRSYSGCFDGVRVALAAAPEILTDGRCVMTLTRSLALTITTPGVLEGFASYFYDASPGCQCSAIFGVAAQSTP